MIRNLKIILAICFLAAGVNADWPTSRADNRRSGLSETILTLPLHPAWSHNFGMPQTAWSEPARQDAYRENVGLQPQRNYDLVYHPVTANGRVYFSSSSDNAVHCLDAATGKELWVFFTDGPVRIAPTVYNGNIFFGSDDGCIYCLNAADGSKVWKYRGAKADFFPSNGKLISMWPCRTGVLIEDNIAYCAFSLFPWRPSYLCALDAEIGRVLYRKEVKGLMLQGALLSDGEKLYLLQGKAPPIILDKKSGEEIGFLKGAGGTWASLSKNAILTHPADQKNPDFLTQLVDRETGKLIAKMRGTERALYDGTECFAYTRGGKLAAFTLGQKKLRWSIKTGYPLEFIKGGNLLFIGMRNRVSAVNTDSGKILWTAPVDGGAYGMALADNSLIVSTDMGTFYAFKQAD